jgi:hypothetical protein
VALHLTIAFRIAPAGAGALLDALAGELGRYAATKSHAEIELGNV